jgi:REP element-mobilizing transposase RayT
MARLPGTPEQKQHNRLSIRLAGYDYSQAGAYFITVCTHNRAHLFGEIRGENTNTPEMILNDLGKMVKKCWKEIPQHFPDVELDEFVVMPNHIHGILAIMTIQNVGVQNVGVQNVGVQNFEPLRNQFQHIIPRSIGSVIRGFKIGVTKWCRAKSPGFSVWQRGYFEHVIRDDGSIKRIREYIVQNPTKWDIDRENRRPKSTPFIVAEECAPWEI